MVGATGFEPKKVDAHSGDTESPKCAQTAENKGFPALPTEHAETPSERPEPAPGDRPWYTRGTTCARDLATDAPPGFADLLMLPDVPNGRAVLGRPRLVPADDPLEVAIQNRAPVILSLMRGNPMHLAELVAALDLALRAAR